MPVLERDPWRMQYFEGVECPEDLIVPTDDPDAYQLFPRQRWVYNKLQVAESQGLEAGPHGLQPAEFPIFSKPVFNMKGMGKGSRIIRSAKEYECSQEPGHMWMTLLEGEHVSSDVAVVDGKARWWRHVVGKAIGEGMFDYWVVEAEPRPAVERYCGDWLRANLKGYTGMVNFETIGERIIECHLRFSDQWPDLYGPGWVDAVVALYRDGRWRFDDQARQTGYSVVLFGAHGLSYSHPEARLIEEICQQPAVSSVQITFHQDKPPEAHSMPPGGFRLAIVNCWEIDAGIEARNRLALSFWSTQKLSPRRRRSRVHA